MNKRLFLALIIMTTWLTSCGGEPISNGVVPDPLQTIEAAAEDIIDFIPSRNWDRINPDTTTIAEAWQSYQVQAANDGAPQDIQEAMSAALVEMETAASAQDATGTWQSANDVSAAVVELYALYNPVIPADIGRLDVLERQVILDVAANDYTAAAESLSKVKTVWESVKPSVLSHNGQDASTQFEDSLAIQESALEAQGNVALTNEATNGLEIVDVLERLY
jgi:hypothetical protein